jgi:hypothetical protein
MSVRRHLDMKRCRDYAQRNQPGPHRLKGLRRVAESGGRLSRSEAESIWSTGLSDLKTFVTPRARGEGFAFNAGRTTELVWRRFGPGQQFDQSSELPLDVVIPVADSDAAVLPLTVASVRRNLTHPVKKIIVITAVGSEAHIVAEQLGCYVIDEDTVVPVRRTNLDYRVGPWDRSGWLFQQFLKLSVDTLSTEDHVFVLDADTVLVRPQTLTHLGEVVALVSSEYHAPYFTAYREILEEAPPSRLSFVAHQAVFNRKTLFDLKNLIEERRERPWWQAILDVCDFSQLSCFSEYELYGNYNLSRNRSVVRRWWANCPLERDHISSLDHLQDRFGSQFRAVSFHHYIRQ